MTAELRTFDDDGVNLSYEIYGKGTRNMIFMHGLLMDSHLNRRLAEALAARGNRVILLDLPGHGRSDKPLRASEHRMDAYAERVIHLMDELKLKSAVIGGMSLGAGVALQVNLQAPERVKAMVIEMPVLERATPVAALLFTPWLIATHYAKPLIRGIRKASRHLPLERMGLLDQLMGPFQLEPEETAAVLHGVLVGPVAPTVEERKRMTQPTLVIGHRSDRLHPFGDANRLSEQLPNAMLFEAHSIAELRVSPDRITSEIADFLDIVWAPRTSARRSA
jgi:pimeloyl-ACP methyl ester carboxylesterase